MPFKPLPQAAPVSGFRPLTRKDVGISDLLGVTARRGLGELPYKTLAFLSGMSFPDITARVGEKAYYEDIPRLLELFGKKPEIVPEEERKVIPTLSRLFERKAAAIAPREEIAGAVEQKYPLASTLLESLFSVPAYGAMAAAAPAATPAAIGGITGALGAAGRTYGRPLKETLPAIGIETLAGLGLGKGLGAPGLEGRPEVKEIAEIMKKHEGAIIKRKPLFPTLPRGYEDFSGEIQDVIFKANKKLNPIEGILKIAEEPTKITKGIYDRELKRVRVVAKDMGREGEQIYGMMEEYLKGKKDYTGKLNLEFAKALREANPTPEEFREVVAVMEGRGIIPEGKLGNLAKVTTKQDEELGLGMEAGKFTTKTAAGILKPFKKMEKHWPRTYFADFLESLKRPERQEEIAKYLTNTGQAKSFDEASARVKQMILQKTGKRISGMYQRVHFPIEEPEKAYSMTPLDWFQHIDRTAGKVIEGKHLGVGGEKVRTLLSSLKAKGYDTAPVTEALDRLLSVEIADSPWVSINSAIRGLSTIGKLGPLTSPLNYLQRYMAIPRAGALKPYLKGREIAFTPEGVDWSIRVGETVPPEFSKANKAFQDVLTLMGREGKITDKYLQWIGMTRTEFNNRVISANVGKQAAEHWFGKLQANPTDVKAYRILKNFGIDVDTAFKTGALTEKDLIRASQQMVRDTQFWYSAWDLPVKWTQPTIGRTWSQFRAAPYQHWMFFKDHVFKEAKEGNITPLLSFLTITAASGEIITNLRHFVRQTLPHLIRGETWETRPRREKGIKRRIIGDIFYGPGFGIAGDVVSLFASGSPTWMTGFIGGPTASSAANLALGGQATVQTGKPRPMVRAITKEVSPTLANIFFPYTKKKKTWKTRKSWR